MRVDGDRGVVLVKRGGPTSQPGIEVKVKELLIPLLLAEKELVPVAGKYGKIASLVRHGISY
jgi:hypothetical protein